MTKRQVIPLLALTILLVLPVPAMDHGASAAPSQPEGWVTLMSEDFEGEFPRGLWHIGREGADYLWGQRECNPHQGLYSMWGGGGGPLGAQIPCTGMYTTGYATTLSYGPFDLSTCSNVRVNFAHWTWLGAGDAFGVGYSIDGGKSWETIYVRGDQVSACGGFCEVSLDQDRWSLHLCGQPKVYLLFHFVSSAADVSYGSFLDDVSLDVYTEGASATATPTPTLTVSPTPTRTVTPTPTRTVTPTATRAVTPGEGEPVYLPLMRR